MITVTMVLPFFHIPPQIITEPPRYPSLANAATANRSFAIYRTLTRPSVKSWQTRLSSVHRTRSHSELQLRWSRQHYCLRRCLWIGVEMTWSTEQVNARSLLTHWRQTELCSHQVDTHCNTDHYKLAAVHEHLTNVILKLWTEHGYCKMIENVFLWVSTVLVFLAKSICYSNI